MKTIRYSLALKIRHYNRSLLGGCLALLLVFSGSPLAVAAQVGGLFHTVVPVANQSQQQRDRGIRSGLANVLVKITGSSGVLRSPEVRLALNNSLRYMSEFGYTSYSAPSEDPEGTSGLGLSVQYSESAINQLLRREQLQIWPANRPALLVWLVVDSVEAGKQHITPELMPDAIAGLRWLMAERGAPLITPMLDLQDQLVLPADSAWGFDEEKLNAAVQRYNTDSWLVVRLYQSSTGQWRASRLLNVEGEISLYNFNAENIYSLLQQAVDGAVDSLAKKHAYIPQFTTEEVAIQLENIRSHKAFNSATAYLEALEVVRHLKVDFVDADRVGIRLAVEGDNSLMLETLRRDPRLQEISDPGGTNMQGAPLHRFRWQGR